MSRVPEKAQRIYAFFHGYESNYGDLSQIQKLEAKMTELYSKPTDATTSSPGLELFTTRHSHHSTDPCSYLPIISRTQTRPKEFFKPIHPVEEPPRTYSPPPMQVTTTMRHASPPPAARISSPKRAAPDTDEERSERVRKIARGDSPILKGAAGRRLNQLKQKAAKNAASSDNQRPGSSRDRDRDMDMQSLPPPPLQPPQPQLPDAIINLLSILPPADAYHAVRFRPEAMVSLLQNLNIPTLSAFYGA